jgi:hypothetical protein
LLTWQECELLMAASEGRLQDAHVVGRGDGLTNSFGYRQVRPSRCVCCCAAAARRLHLGAPARVVPTPRALTRAALR